MSVRSEVLLWAQRVVARKGAAPHVLLEVDTDSGVEDAQAAFHKIARMAHPDLHRSSLTADELELVTTAYARVAGAYQELRSQRMTTMRLRPIHQLPRSSAARMEPVPLARPEAGAIVSQVAPAGGPTGAGAASAMSAKALIYYRKAEMALRRGDLKGAVLQLKLAIATDPQSPFLRTALSEVEIEVRKQ